MFFCFKKYIISIYMTNNLYSLSVIVDDIFYIFISKLYNPLKSILRRFTFQPTYYSPISFKIVFFGSILRIYDIKQLFYYQNIKTYVEYRRTLHSSLLSSLDTYVLSKLLFFLAFQTFLGYFYISMNCTI